MAASDVSKKCRLKQGLLYVYRVRGGNRKSSVILEISICNYFKLKENTHYSVPIKKLDCVIDVCKTRKAVTVTFFAIKDRESRIRCFVIYDSDSRAQPVAANRTSRREYEMRISNKIIHDAKNWLIQQGAFIFQLEISTENVSAVVIRPNSSTRRQSTRGNSFEPSAPLNVATGTVDDEKLVYDLRNLSNGEMFTDFTIYVKNTTQSLHVHKSLLAARSEFFYNHIAKEYSSEIELDVSPDILTLVMSFMYYGQLPVTQLGDILEVLQLAVALKIKSLEDQCVYFVKDNVDGENVHAIMERGLTLGLKKLVTIAEDFLAEYK